MKIGKLIFYSIWLSLLGLLIWFNFSLISNYYTNNNVVDSVQRQYTGRIHFTNPDDYENFKQELAERKDITINQITELSSENPLIDFSINISSDNYFDYGEMTYEHIYYKAYLSDLLFTIIVVDVVCLFVLGIILYIFLYNSQMN